MAERLTLGSLFDGSGGFPLGGLLAGITPVWASEIEPFPIRVTIKRLPFMKHYGDVSKIDGGKVEPVDIITFGSPCQDMSVAGKRAGLDGSRSSLFYEDVRVIKEMRYATDGQYPKFLCWENVPGAFSSNSGNDFKAVLDEIRRIKEPEADTPRPEKWPNAGCVLADDYSVAWRLLDAQYFGVAQRRKRIYLVADLTGGRAGKILFESEGLSGYSAESFRARQRTAGGTESGSHPASIGFDGYNGSLTEDKAAALGVNCGQSTGRTSVMQNDSLPIENHSADSRVCISKDGKVQTLTSRMGTGGMNIPLVLRKPEAKAFGICSKDSNSMKSSNPHSGIYEAETARTIDCSGGNPVCNQGGMAIVAIEGNGARPSHQGSGFSEDDVSFTLNATEHTALHTKLTGNNRFIRQVYGCAADRQQASIVFEVAADMIRMCPALNRRCKILTATKRIVYTPTNSFYQVLSAEAYSKHGFNIHGVVFDELHTQPNRKLFDVMTKGSGDARTQPLYFLITTAGTDTHSICYETHQKAKDILEGRKVDPTFCPVIYGADEGDDWTDPKVWKKANPSLGITVDIEKVRAACESAKQNPAEENSFRQLRLNQWVRQAVRWMPMEKWDKCAFAVNEEDLEGRVCYGGLDLSSTTDITAFVLVFPPRTEDEKYIILPYFWIPEDNLSLRVRRDHVPYDLWERQGFLQTTEGNVVHYGYIEQFIERLGKRFNIREIAYDRWGAVQMIQNLEGMGFTVVPFGQGFKDMSPPTKELMKLVLEERIAHGGHPALRWMMDNIYIRTDPAGNIKPDKEKSTEKIDGAVTTIMALDRAIRCGNDTSESVYDSRGILFL